MNIMTKKGMYELLVSFHPKMKFIIHTYPYITEIYLKRFNDKIITLNDIKRDVKLF